MADALVRVVLEGDNAVAGANRIDQALGRLERTEPTRAVRSTRVAIDELATQGPGLHRILGRLLASFTELGIGGVVGLAAVGGLAAIGLEMKALIGFGDALDAKMLKLNTTLAQGSPAAKLFSALAAGKRAEDLAEPGFFEGQDSGVRTTQLAGIADITEGLAQARSSERATALNQENLDL